MIKFLIDVNLPYKFSLWNHEPFQHVKEIDDEWSDSQIWQYAKKNALTIVTKDVDFSNRTTEPPPKVIHIKVGNMKMSAFHDFMDNNWEEIIQLNGKHKLVNVYRDQVFGID